MHPSSREHIDTLNSERAKRMAEMLVASDHTLTQLHVTLSIVHEAIETETGITDLKNALYAAIKVRRQ